MKVYALLVSQVSFVCMMLFLGRGISYYRHTISVAKEGEENL